MIGFLLSPLGLRILAGLAIAGLVMGLVWSHDSKVRAKEATKWQAKLSECELVAKAANDANAKLDADYRRFIAQHNAEVKAQADEQERRLRERDKALAALSAGKAKDQGEINRLRALAAAGPQPTKEGACAQADATLRGLANDLVRDDAGK